MSPRLSTVSIIPGIETRAPERTLTSSGSFASPNLAPTSDSTWVIAARTSPSSAGG
jgi:hypothetical protein